MFTPSSSLQEFLRQSLPPEMAEQAIEFITIRGMDLNAARVFGINLVVAYCCEGQPGGLMFLATASQEAKAEAVLDVERGAQYREKLADLAERILKAMRGDADLCEV